MIDTFLICLVLGIFCRTIAVMIIYSLQYGQLLGNVKIWVAQNIDFDLTIKALNDVSSQSEGEQKAIELYDILCNYKYTGPNKGWSWFLSLLDCQFCIGFWVSVLVGIGCVCFGLPLWVLVILPIITFFYTEKI